MKKGGITWNAEPTVQQAESIAIIMEHSIPRVSAGYCQKKFDPRGFGNQGAEAYFASVTERAESLARFGPPGFDLGTPTPGVQLVPSWLLPSELVPTVSATGAASAIFPAEAGPSQRWLLLSEIMHKQRISLHILSDYSVLVVSPDDVHYMLWSTIR